MSLFVVASSTVMQQNVRESPLSIRVRAQWEFAALHIVRGNNLWIILNYRW